MKLFDFIKSLSIFILSMIIVRYFEFIGDTGKLLFTFVMFVLFISYLIKVLHETEL